MQQLSRMLGCWALAALAAWTVAPLERQAHAQEPAKPRTAAPATEQPGAGPAPPAEEPPLPGELLPRVYMLKDKDGKLQAVPGFPFEQFVELYKLKHQLDEQHRQPDYTVEKLVLSGAAAARRVELTAEFTIELHASGWVRVPLRLGFAVLREPAAHAGPGEHYLHYEDGDGYVSWIRSEPGKSHTLSLELLVPVAPLGPETHLQLDIPRATVSRLDLEVPLEQPVVTVSEGSTLEPSEPVAGGRTRIRVAGLATPFDVGWHSAESQVASLPTVLESSAVQTIRIDGRSVNSEARLTVRSSGGTFDRFQVRLPPGAEYVETPQGGLTVAPLPATSGKGKLYEIKLGKQTTGPVELRLVSQRAYDPLQASEPLELAGFDVLGAVRQWGTIAVQVEGNWQIQWAKDDRVRDELAGASRREGVTAAFEYTAQPYSLTARLTPQRTRMRIEGEYVVIVSGDEAQLRGKLKYLIRGAKVRTLEIDLPGWEVDRVGPAGPVNVDEAEADEAGHLVVPLSQPTSGELELSVEARQKIAVDATRVELDLPRPHGDTVAPSNVVVLPADNVDLVVEPEASTGLAAPTSRPAWKQPPDRQQDPQFYRTTAPAARLVASRKVFEQSISAAMATRIDVDDRETNIDERIAFQIDYYPTDHLVLDVPKLVRAERLTVTLDGQKLAPALVREPAEGDSSDRVQMRVPLGASRIGRCELLVNYSVRHERLSNRSKSLIKIPLVLPGETTLTSNELAIVPRPGVTVTYPKGLPVSPWIEDSRTGRQAGPGAIALTARRGLPDVALSASSKDERTESTSTVERAWIETRLTNGHREDRALYRVISSEPRLRVALPDGAELSTMEVELDGRRIKTEFEALGESSELVVPLSAAGGEHLLELRYHFIERAPAGSLALEPPRLKPTPWIRQLYWQLVLPEHEHLLFTPEAFTREFRWVWQAPYWRRVATLDDPELERWMGIAPAETEPGSDAAGARRTTAGATTNRYLFSSVGQPVSLGPTTILRSRLVLFASLPLLALGLLWIYFPVTRHPAVALLVALCVAAISLIDPEVALLFAQAATIGLVLVVAAVLLARVSLRTPPATVPVRGSSRSLAREAHEYLERGVSSGSQPSTTTNPLLTSPAPESAT